MAASARLTIPLEPVPITGQTFGVLVVAMALGSRLGTLALAAYLLEGLAGLPVFAGGAFGPAAIAGPSGGYLIGYLPAAWLIGRLAEMGWDRTVTRTALAMLAGNVALYVPGLLWLGWHVAALPVEDLGGQSLATVVLWAGLIPFIPGDAIKLALAAVVMPLAWKWLLAAGAERSNKQRSRFGRTVAETCVCRSAQAEWLTAFAPDRPAECTARPSASRIAASIRSATSG